MRFSKLFESKHLRAEDMDGEELTVTIDRLEMMEVGTADQPEKKPVLFFRELKKGLVLNKTNGKTLSYIYGDDSDNWLGKEAILYETTTEFKGQTVPCLRLRVSKEQVAKFRPVTAVHERVA